MSIPFGFLQGNRSEYLAIPALTKLGFTVPVPRQEDHFGIDFIVHLAELIDNTVYPKGKSFGIQIKSNHDSLDFDNQKKRDCLYDSALPFFIGVISRENLTLTIYNTVNRLNYYWVGDPKKDFTLTFDGNMHGLPPVKIEEKIIPTGNPILEINISEPSTPPERSQEIRKLESIIESWIDLENENLSLKQLRVPLVYCPTSYSINTPLPKEIDKLSHTKQASWNSFPCLCNTLKKNVDTSNVLSRQTPTF